VGEDGQAGAIEAELRDALGGWGAAVDVSDSRVGVRLSGPAAREVLASCVALDFHPTRFQPGHCAQTLLGKVPVLVQQLDEAPTYCLRSRPSMAAYLVDWLVDGVIGTRLDR
jgi:sarcosine oxidase subunit gamma